MRARHGSCGERKGLEKTRTKGGRKKAPAEGGKKKTKSPGLWPPARKVFVPKKKKPRMDALNASAPV